MTQAERPPCAPATSWIESILLLVIGISSLSINHDVIISGSTVNDSTQSRRGERDRISLEVGDVILLLICQGQAFQRQRETLELVQIVMEAPDLEISRIGPRGDSPQTVYCSRRPVHLVYSIALIE